MPHSFRFLLLVLVLLETSARQSTTAFLPNHKQSRIRFLKVSQEVDAEVLSDDIEEAEAVLKKSRWHSLNPKIKNRLIEKGQARAVANKKKREPVRDKKRRLAMYVKEKQREKKRAARVQRPLPLDQRTPLMALKPKMELSGVVISLTHFGAYVDVGTECDGLLHISQMSNTTFVTHPRQLFTPGDEITVKVKSTNPSRKKLHLTLLDVTEEEEEEEEDWEEKIPLEDVDVDDELWGILKRVTDYGAYVDVGAQVAGFLHFMDHPEFGDGHRHPTEFMEPGTRVRVWVSDVDLVKNRIKLTANRPPHLPGPRRDVY